MCKESAIKKLICNGMTEKEAIQEFNEKVNYYLGGTLHTASDVRYVTECAIDDIIDDEAEEVDEAMLDLLYN